MTELPESAADVGGASSGRLANNDPGQACALLAQLEDDRWGTLQLGWHSARAAFVLARCVDFARHPHPDGLARLEREIAVLGPCRHPNVVELIAHGTVAGMSSHVTELVDGTSLSELGVALCEGRSLGAALLVATERWRARWPALSRHLPPPRLASHLRDPDVPRQLAQFFLDVAEGLAHIHARGALHLDVRPGNVLIEAGTGRAVLTGAGLAMLDSASASFWDIHARAWRDPRYAAPELLSSRRKLDGRADIHALGVTMHELLATQKPMDSSGLASDAHSGWLHGRIALPELPSGIPSELADIARSAANPSIERRCASALELAARLRAFLRNVSSGGQPHGWLARLSGRARAAGDSRA